MNNFDNNHDKRKKLTIDFLTKEGYPNISPERVLELGTGIYKVWDQEGVIPEGMNLESFNSKLTELYNHHLLLNTFGISFK